MGFLIKLKGKSLEEIKIFLEIAVDNIINGKIIAFPTDSVYGIGGNPIDLTVINNIYDIKYRDRSKGLLLLISDREEAKKVAKFDIVSEKLAKHFWPGQLTLILKRKEPNIIPHELTAYKKTIGVRVPNNKILVKLLKMLKSRGYFGGIIGTSANYSGEPPCISGDEIAKKFLTPIDLIIDSGKSRFKKPTTILDCTTKKPKFLRIGTITREEIQKVLNN